LVKAETEKISDAFMQEHMPMVESIVNYFSSRASLPSGLEKEDLISWGVEGLIKAHRNFNPDKGSKFSTYAFYRIRGEIHDKMRHEWQYRNPQYYQEERKKIQERIADIIEQSIQDNDFSSQNLEESVYQLITHSTMGALLSIDNLEDHIELSSDESASNSSEYDVLWEEIHSLDPEEKEVIELLYIKGLKQKEIASKLNSSNSKICRIHVRALEKLKNRISRRGKLE